MGERPMPVYRGRLTSRWVFLRVPGTS